MQGHMPDTADNLTFNFDREPKEAVCEDGAYTVKLINIGKPFERTTVYNGSPKTQMKCVFKFQIIGGEYEGAELDSFVAVDASPLNEKSNIHKVLKALYGGTIPEGGKINASELIGKKCRVVVVNEVKGENVYTNIRDFLAIAPVAPKKPSPKVATEVKPQFDESGEELSDLDEF